MTPDHKRLLAALLVRLSRSAKRWLDDHSWRPVADLARRIEAVDFDRRVDYEPKPHDAKPLTGRPKAAAGRVLLMPELIEVLTKDGACEVRDGAAGQEIRLVGAATADVAAPQCCNGTVETAVQRRRRVDAAAKVLKEGCPDLVAAVEQDRVSVSAAADLAELPPEEQAEAARQGGRLAATTAREVRQREQGAAKEPQAATQPPVTLAWPLTPAALVLALAARLSPQATVELLRQALRVARERDLAGTSLMATA